MSQSSAQSASSSHVGGGVGFDGQVSPVPYRPLEYTPEVKCDCNMKACRWISWSNGQPGRRYHRCRRARTRQDCLFFHWEDEECSPWYKELLRDLRDAVWELKKEVAKKEEKLQANEDKVQALEAKMKNKNQCIDALAFFCIVLLIMLVVQMLKGKQA